jgi:hypothetical protein
MFFMDRVLSVERIDTANGVPDCPPRCPARRLPEGRLTSRTLIQEIDMGFLTTVVKLAAVGVAANMVLKARRDGNANRTGIGAPAIDAPNDAGRLQARDFGSPPPATSSVTDRLSSSTPPDGSTARTPVLTDYARGAQSF